MSIIHHALVLNLHQPPGNLEYLLAEKPWEAREILYAYDRIPRFLWSYEDIARVHITLSGTLLETLSSPDFQHGVYGIVDCGSLLWHLQNRKIIDILGTGYYYPILPLIPEADREAHLTRWRGIAQHLFWREDFQGFWPPEMGFAMELIPLLKRAGYRFVVVDSEHVEPVTPMTDHELRYRPHIARHDGEEIVVIVRDRELSDAQMSGMDYVWFVKEIAARTQPCDFEPLVTTCSDGENGNWFRNTNSNANFWGAFYKELLEDSRNDGPIRPAFIHDYLERFGAHGEVRVNTGAWNTEWHDGKDFTQWMGSPAQQESLQRLRVVSAAVHQAMQEAVEREMGTQEQAVLEEALWRLLRAETSCNFYWGEDWVHRATRDLDDAEATLRRFRAKKYSIDADPGWHTPSLTI
jgi:alpha-amylase/alpha-mannosidase (GH57 family)